MVYDGSMTNKISPDDERSKEKVSGPDVGAASESLLGAQNSAKSQTAIDARIASGLMAIDETFSRGMARMEMAAASSVAGLRSSGSRQLMALAAILAAAMALGLAIVYGALAG